MAIKASRLDSARHASSSLELALLGGIAMLALALGACAPRTMSQAYRSGETAYLWETHPVARPYTPQADVVSYWEGDGVPGAPRITIRLGEQKALFYKGDRLVGVSAISSGSAEHPTPTGSFRISEKSPDHKSNLYGDFVAPDGTTVLSNVDVRTDTPPPGSRFDGASMPNFMRFNRGIGLHAGYLPGYPASHGCVRMPDYMARKFYENVAIGTPVQVVP